MKKNLLILICSLFTSFSFSQIDYFGQTPPGATPEIFSPGFISLENQHEFNPVFSPDGKEFYFTISNPPTWSFSKTMVSRFVNNEWTEPEEIDFGGDNIDWGNCFSPDGNTLYFNSAGTDWIFDIWYVHRMGSGWSTANKLSETINSIGSELAYSVSNDSVLYFRSTGEGNEDIYYSQKLNGQYDSYTRLMAPINTDKSELNPIIRKGDSCLIFTVKRAGNIFDRDICISFKSDNNQWSSPQILIQNATCGSITPDNKYLLYNAGTNYMDIYWVELDSLINNVITSNKQPSTGSVTNDVLIFPNPTNKIIQIKTNDIIWKIQSIQIVDIRGEVVKQEKMECEVIDISNLSKGTYVINLVTNKEIISKKLVLE